MNKQQLEQQYDLVKQQIKEKLNLIKVHLASIEECKKDIDQLGMQLSDIQTLYNELTNKEQTNENK